MHILKNKDYQRGNLTKSNLNIQLKIKAVNKHCLTVVFFRFLVILIEILINTKMLKKEVSERRIKTGLGNERI